MSNIYDILSKIANDENVFRDWESGLDPKVKRERELIKSVQSNNDKFAMKQLMKDYRNVINQEVSKSQLSKTMESGMAQQYGMSIFKDLIKNNFDLSKPNKPITYIKTVLPQKLSKKKNEFMDLVARKSEDLTAKTGYTSIARDFLKRELDREPNIDEIHNFITKDMGLKIELKNVQRIQDLTRRELSGNEQVGGKNDSGAEFLTLMDIKNVGSISPEEIFNDSLLKGKIENQLPNFTRPQRRLIRHYFGLGQFEGKPAKSQHQAAIKSNMTYYDAKRTLDKLVDNLQQQDND